MNVTVVSDTICPWCYIGKRNLDRAIAKRPDLDVVVDWRAFMLDPTIPPGGVERKAYLRAKFGDFAGSRGDRPKAMAEALRQAAEDSGIALAFDRITVTPNTRDSHRLIRWARSVGLQDEIVEALFDAYFTQGRDIGDVATLADIAGSTGMDRELVSGLLASDADINAVTREITFAQQIGITGVPTFIIDDTFTVVGAQSAETLIGAFEQARELARERARELSMTQMAAKA